MIPTIRLNFHPLETALPDNNGITAKCTTYEGQITHNNIVHNSIEYAFDYDVNVGQGCFFCCPTSTTCGFHEGDRERIMLLRNPANPNIIDYVYFNAHSPGQGCWKSWNECHKDIDGNLIAYVARGSHAFYPDPVTYLRIFGFANDQCSNDGVSLLTLVTGTHTDFVIPKQRSITETQRFFLPIVVKCLRNGP